MITTTDRRFEKPEVELCKALALWLRGNGWEASEEPAVYLPGQRTPLYPDFVIARNDIIGVVEAKATRDNQARYMGVTRQALEQAQRWRPIAQVTYIAVNEPHASYRQQHEMLAQMAHVEGIGLLIRRHVEGRGVVKHVYESSVNVKAAYKPLMGAMIGHRDVLAAGTAAGHRFRKTDRQWDWVHDLVRREGGITGLEPKDVSRLMPELVAEEVRKAFKAAERGHIAGVRVSKAMGPRRLVLVNGGPDA